MVRGEEPPLDEALLVTVVIVVKAVPKAEFEQWLASKKPAPVAEPAPAAPEAAPADAAPATDAAPIAETPAPSAQG